MLDEFEKLYNAKKTDFDDLALVKKAMQIHNEEKKKFETEYLVLKMAVINPTLQVALGHFKNILKGDDIVKKIKAQDVANHFTKASNHIEGLLLKIKGKTILFSVDCDIESQKIFTNISIKDTSFKVTKEIEDSEFTVGYIQQQVVEAYNYINKN